MDITTTLCSGLGIETTAKLLPSGHAPNETGPATKDGGETERDVELEASAFRVHPDGEYIEGTGNVGQCKARLTRRQAGGHAPESSPGWPDVFPIMARLSVDVSDLGAGSPPESAKMLLVKPPRVATAWENCGIEYGLVNAVIQAGVEGSRNGDDATGLLVVVMAVETLFRDDGQAPIQNGSDVAALYTRLSCDNGDNGEMADFVVWRLWLSEDWAHSDWLM